MYIPEACRLRGSGPDFCLLYPLTWILKARSDEEKPATCWCAAPRARELLVRGTQPHSLAYVSLIFLGHMAQKSKGKVSQRVGLHAAPCIGILFPYWSGPPGLDKVGDKYANACGS